MRTTQRRTPTWSTTATLLVALVVLAANTKADCDPAPTEPVIGGPCDPVPAGYTMPAEPLNPGERCRYAPECKDGVCVRAEGQDWGYCAAWGVDDCLFPEDYTGWVYGDYFLPILGTQDCTWELRPYCIETRDFRPVCPGGCCADQASCVTNNDCCSGWCYIPGASTPGTCVPFCEDGCPDAWTCRQIGIDLRSPSSVCVPPQ